MTHSQVIQASTSLWPRQKLFCAWTTQTFCLLVEKKCIHHEILMNRNPRFTITVVELHQISILNRYTTWSKREKVGREGRRTVMSERRKDKGPWWESTCWLQRDVDSKRTWASNGVCIRVYQRENERKRWIDEVTVSCIKAYMEMKWPARQADCWKHRLWMNKQTDEIETTRTLTCTDASARLVLRKHSWENTQSCNSFQSCSVE